MPTPGKATRPKSDDEYFERMSKAVFTAGLNWRTIENKWAGFNKAFASFSPAKVSQYSEKKVQALLTDEAIVRNEKKIRATVHNAGEFLKINKEHGSFREFLDSFHKDEEKLQMELQERFKHLGPSTARMFLWSVAHPLTPTASEKKWISSHKHD